MERKALALVVAQFVVIGVLAVKVYEQGETAEPAARKDVSAGQERPKDTRSTRSADDRRGRRAPASTGETSLPDSLDPAQAAELLGRNQKETKNLGERAEKAHAIIRRLCQNGHVREAWDLIDPEYGLVRFRELEAFFEAAKFTPAEALAHMDGLDGADRGSALKGYFGSFSADEFAALDLTIFKLENGRERAALIGNFADRLRAACDDENPDPRQAAALVEKATRLTAERKLSIAELGGLLNLDKSQDSFAHWATVTTLPEDAKKGDNPYEGVQAKLIREMTLEDPERLMALTMIEGAPEKRFMHIAFEKWLEADNASATQWYESRREGFSVEQNDGAAVAFLRTCVRYEEYETALKWYDSLVSPAWRSAVAYAQRNAQNGLKKKEAKEAR